MLFHRRLSQHVSQTQSIAVSTVDDAPPTKTGTSTRAGGSAARSQAQLEDHVASDGLAG